VPLVFGSVLSLSVCSFFGSEVRGSCFPYWCRLCSEFAGLGKCCLFSSRFWPAHVLLIFLLKSWSSFSCTLVFGPASRAPVRISVYPFAGRFFSQELLAPSFRPLLRPWSVFLWLVFGLEHQVALLFLTLFVLWSAPWEVFPSWFSLRRESLQLMFSSPPVAASLILILLLLDSAAPVGNLLPAWALLHGFTVLIQQLGLNCRLVWFTQLLVCSVVFWPLESPPVAGGKGATGSKVRVFLVFFVLRS
jgi:hypothetical protein